MATPGGASELMAMLRSGLDTLLHAIETGKGMTPKEWMTYYNHAFKLCTQEKEEELYNMVKKLFRDNVAEHLAKLQKFKGEELLREYLRLYGNYKEETRSISKILKYLHRFWIPNQKSTSDAADEDKVREIFPLSLVQWRKHCYKKHAEELRMAALEIVDQERNKEVIDKTLIKKVVESYNDLAVDKGISFYEEEFERQFLEGTKLYYIKESTQFLGSGGGVSAYLKKAEERISVEEENASAYYPASTCKPKLKNALDDALITQHFEVLQQSFQKMIEEDQEDDMRRFYFLFSRLADGLANSSKTFQNHLKTVGAGIIKEQAGLKEVKKIIENAIPFIKALLALQRKYLHIVDKCFSNNILFQQAMDRAFTEVVNMKTGKFTMARLLSFYLDSVLKGKEKVEESKMDQALDEIVRLFAYFQDKDSFAEYIRKGLCKRILDRGKSFNETAEMSLIAKLKAQCGNNYTRHLQGMFQDIEDESAKALGEKFIEWNKGELVEGIELSVKVLNESHWPISASEKFPLALPGEMSSCVVTFEKFYKEATDKRKKLRWLYNFGTVSLSTGFNKGILQLVITPLQAAILMLFNANEVITFEEMFKRLWPDGGSRTTLTESAGSGTSKISSVSHRDTLRYSLGPMVYSKTNVVSRDGVEAKRGAILNEDKFSLVRRVKTKKRRVTFPAGSARKAAAQDKEIQGEVMKQREFEVDAAIVRLMKTRNVLSWNELQIQVKDALKHRFGPTPRLLKKRLESLIEREFMERDPDDSKKIKYIA